MKNLVLIGGAMGVGKTTVAKALAKEIPKSAFLDGDWCWDLHPFVVTPETKTMVITNIKFLIRQFLTSTEVETVIFCWVMDHQEIIQLITEEFEASVNLFSISLVASPLALTRRIEKDIERGIREKSALENSLARLPLYQQVNSWKLDTSDLECHEAVKTIQNYLKNQSDT